MSASMTATQVLPRSIRSLRGFFAWWRANLLSWFPATLRNALRADRDRVLFQVLGDDLQLRRQHDDAVEDVAGLPLPLPGSAGMDPMTGVLRDGARELPRWLLLPASMGLRRSLVLPAAAGDRLRDVLGFEIERQTPFSAADVVYDGHVLQRRDDGQLQVELVVVPRKQYESAAMQIQPLMPWLAGVDLADGDGRTLGVNLLPPDQRTRRRDAWIWWKLGIALVGLLALAWAMARIVENREAAARTLQAEVARNAEQARVVSVRRQQLLDAVEGSAYLQQQRNGRASTVEVMNTLAGRMPDGTYLEKLSIEGEQLTLIGLSNQAAALVGKLEGAQQWDAPALSGALQQDPRSRMDRFTLVAQLRVAKSAEVPRADR